jgi:nucleoside-diphosphate-sugar epimerase
MKNLVLGSSGLIGSYLLGYLDYKDEEHIELDIKNSPFQDLRDPTLIVHDKFMQADFVYFLAFDVGGSKYLNSNQNTCQFIQNNLRIMDNTFELLDKYKKPFLFVSSQMASLEESAYGNLKLVGEKYTQSLRGKIARLWNVYGVQDEGDKAYVITDFIRSALTKGKITMRTDGSEKRQFLHADDCCGALHKLANSDLQDVDISSFEWTTILDLAKMIAEKTGAVIETSTNKDSVQRARLAEPRRDILSIWKPYIDLNLGLNLTIWNYMKDGVGKDENLGV